MADTADVLQKAQTLGAALVAHPTVQGYVAAQRAVRDDKASQQALRAYQQHVDHVRQLEAQRKPIEVADKHKLQDLERALAGHDALKKLMRIQADYLLLMNQVNEAMEGPVAELMQGEQSA